MHRSFFTLAFSTLGLAGSALAQDAGSAPVGVAQPTSPAPAVVSAPAAAPAPTQIVYTPKLPTAQELTDAAAAQGMTVERISQTALQVIAFYRNANGQPVTVAYQTLPPSGVAQTPAPAQPAPAVVVTAPPPTVVYETAPRVVYYESPAYYYPRYYYPPVSLSFGFGYRGGYGGHHHHHR
jgi:hypothetical protein